MPNWLNVRPSWQLDDPTTEYTKAFQVANEVRLAPLKYQQAKNALAQQTIDLANAGLQNQRATMQIKSEMEAMPYKLDALKQEDKMRQNALDLESARRDGASMLFDFAASNSKKLGTWEYSDGLSKLAKDNRLLLLTSEFQELWKQNETAKQTARVLGLGDGTLDPTKLPPGASMKVGAVTLHGAAEDVTTKDLKKKEEAQSDLQKLTDAYTSMPDDDPSKPDLQKKIVAARDRVAAYDTKLKGQQTEISTTNPDGTTTSVRIGSGGSVPGTSGTVTGNIQKGLSNQGLGRQTAIKVAQYESAMELNKYLEDNLDAGDVGVLGNIREVINRTVGQVNPAAVNSKVQAVRNKIIQLRESVETQIPEGGRESVQRRESVLKSLPTDGIFESEGTARAALKSTRELLASRARNYAGEVGRIPLVSMSRQEMNKSLEVEYKAVGDRVRAGLLTPEQGNAMVQSIWNEYQDAARRFLPSK